MPPSWWSSGLWIPAMFLVPLILGLASLVIVRVLRKLRAQAKRKREDPARCAKCGYSLEGLDIPRCPECGALRGFTVPLDQLGLTEHEVRKGFARRRQERPSTDESSPPDNPSPPDDAPPA